MWHRIPMKVIMKVKLSTLFFCCLWVLSTTEVLPHDDHRYPDYIINDPRVVCLEDGSFPHPANCSWFYRCNDWLDTGYFHVFFFECEPGTIFLDPIDQCVFGTDTTPPCAPGATGAPFPSSPSVTPAPSTFPSSPSPQPTSSTTSTSTTTPTTSSTTTTPTTTTTTTTPSTTTSSTTTTTTTTTTPSTTTTSTTTPSTTTTSTTSTTTPSTTTTSTTSTTTPSTTTTSTTSTTTPSTTTKSTTTPSTTTTSTTTPSTTTTTTSKPPTTTTPSGSTSRAECILCVDRVVCEVGKRPHPTKICQACRFNEGEYQTATQRCSRYIPDPRLNENGGCLSGLDLCPVLRQDDENQVLEDFASQCSLTKSRPDDPEIRRRYCRNYNYCSPFGIHLGTKTLCGNFFQCLKTRNGGWSTEMRNCAGEFLYSFELDQCLPQPKTHELCSAK